MEEENNFESAKGDLPAGGLSSVSEESGGIVTARGTKDGLIVRLDGRVDFDTIKKALANFVSSRKDFLAGNEVILEWISLEPGDDFVSELSEMLLERFTIKVKSSRLRERQSKRESRNRRGASDLASRIEISEEELNRPLSLFDGVESIDMGSDSLEKESDEAPSIGAIDDARGASIEENYLWDDPDARVIFSTLRSGQKIESDHSVVICGDVNSGAEIVAGGDIIVLGILRGVAHAGAYDETGGGRFIFGLDLQPTQLRIGSVISRGSPDASKAPEIARVDGNIIVVEPYQSRTSMLQRHARRRLS